MKITIQFANDGNPNLNENVDIEIPDDVMKQFETSAKAHNTSVDNVIRFYLTSIMRQIEDDEMKVQEPILIADS